MATLNVLSNWVATPTGPPPWTFIAGILQIGIQANQSPIIQRQITILNIVNLLVVVPAWVLLTASYLVAKQSSAALLLGSALGLILTMVLLRANERLGLGTYWQATLCIVFVVPCALSLVMGGNQHSGFVLMWSIITPLLVILLDQPRAACAWFGLLLALNALSLISQRDWPAPLGITETWTMTWQAFNRLGVSSVIFCSLLYLTKKQRQAIDHLDHFAALVAHELRNPLTSISLGLGHGLREADHFSESQKQALGTAHQEAKRCQQILNDLLALSREPSNHWALSLQTIDPYPLLKEVAERAGSRLGVRVNLDCPHQEWERLAWVDPNRLVQVVENLIENSAKYADRPQGIELSIQAQPASRQLLIQVADRGEILPDQDCQQIFTPFYRGANAKGKTGSGLGLTIVRRLVSAMGGNVKAEARQGGGLLVSLTLAKAPDRRSKPRSPSVELATTASPSQASNSQEPLIPA